MQRIAALLLALVGSAYLATTIWSFLVGGFVVVYQTAASNEPSSLSFMQHILVNRVLYSALCIGLLAAAAMFVSRPRSAAFVLIGVTPILINDGGGALFDLLSNILLVAPSGDSFELFYNRIDVPRWLWYNCIAVVAAAIAFGLMANNSFKPTPSARLN